MQQITRDCNFRLRKIEIVFNRMLQLTNATMSKLNWPIKWTPLGTPKTNVNSEFVPGKGIRKPRP